MKKLIVLAVLLCCCSSMLLAQKYITRTGQIAFTATTPLENINAVNNESAGILDAATGDVIFETLIKGFKFKVALMQEHFNEEYLESDQFPKATFKGKITNMTTVDVTKNGAYSVQAVGKLTIHGVTKDVSMAGTVKVSDNGNEITITSELKVAPEDYNITIPSLVRNKIAKVVQINVNALMHKR